MTWIRSPTWNLQCHHRDQHPTKFKALKMWRRRGESIRGTQSYLQLWSCALRHQTLPQLHHMIPKVTMMLPNQSRRQPLPPLSSLKLILKKRIILRSWIQKTPYDAMNPCHQNLIFFIIMRKVFSYFPYVSNVWGWLVLHMHSSNFFAHVRWWPAVIS